MTQAEIQAILAPIERGEQFNFTDAQREQLYAAGFSSYDIAEACACGAMERELQLYDEHPELFVFEAPY